MKRVLLLLSLGVVSFSVDNGFTVPAMGYSTWNDCSSMRNNGPEGWCWDTEDHVKNITKYLQASGLSKLGFNRINIDEGWFVGRHPNGTMIDDREKFPSGMKGLGDWITAQDTGRPGEKFHYGLYSCRGTCQCGTSTYHADGSHGHEIADVNWMVDAGADYLKIDSCCGDQTHSVAFSDYTKFRDAINATGKQVWFSLCGWHDWYAPPDPSIGYKGGASLGNSWRIAGDGSGWGPLTNCMNVMAEVSQYGGLGGWNDPDLLIGPEVYVGGQTDQQARAQFSMWSLFPANLIISQNMLRWSSYALETYSNAEAISINQDPLGSPAFRLVGSDLPFPCSTGASTIIATVCDPSDASQAFSYNASSKTIQSNLYPKLLLTDVDCKTDSGSPVALMPSQGYNGCGGPNRTNQVWEWQNKHGTIISALQQQLCLDVNDWKGPAVQVWGCNGGSNQNFTFDAKTGAIATVTSKQGSSMCLSAQAVQQCTNVWGRKLSDGYALGFVNNGAQLATVTCDSSCFAKMGIPATSKESFSVRDVWAHGVVATIKAPFSFSASIDGGGYASLYRLTSV
mmetsp:Transcript_24229/g.47642  ORF Transcript_24229/g.47642 Transcript_24229/m.47642 type:complete len:566 (-) Transcript_24229:689-2386(-)